MSSLVIDASPPHGNDLRELQRIAAFVNAALPDLAITDTFAAADQTAMLALSAQKGDLAVRADLNQTFVLKGDDPSILGNWQSLDNIVVQTLINGDTLHSPSSDVVFDALALKALKQSSIAISDLVAEATADAASQSGSYVQADVQSIAALANALKADMNLVVTLVNALKAKVNAMNA